jgi:hypothetical protein
MAKYSTQGGEWNDVLALGATHAGGSPAIRRYFFCKEMRACKNKLSLADLLKKVRADLAAGHYSQIPQLECDATVRRASIA